MIWLFGTAAELGLERRSSHLVQHDAAYSRSLDVGLSVGAMACLVRVAAILVL
jgi:hypothetical protein